MPEYSVIAYTMSRFNEWNDFIAASKNGTFLFNRGFMEYHSDRFDDYSLMVFIEDKLVAVLPAHKTGNSIYSHFGLTYGGLIYSEKVKLADIIKAFRAVLEYLHKNTIEKLYVKLIPSIYHKLPADEFSYSLFLVGGLLIRKDSLAVIDQQNKLSVSRSRKEGIKRGDKNGLVIKEETSFDSFWNEILIPNILVKHGANPVHTLDEIKMLHAKFPENIRQFNVYHNDKIVAGTTLFLTDTVAHSQYISGNKDKNELGSLDFLYDYLINTAFVNFRFFDLGTSNEAQGTQLNEGLSFWKEGFGARTITQDFYEVEPANFTKLDNVLI